MSSSTLPSPLLFLQQLQDLGKKTFLYRVLIHLHRYLGLQRYLSAFNLWKSNDDKRSWHANRQHTIAPFYLPRWASKTTATVTFDPPSSHHAIEVPDEFVTLPSPSSSMEPFATNDDHLVAAPTPSVVEQAESNLAGSEPASDLNWRVYPIMPKDLYRHREALKPIPSSYTIQPGQMTFKTDKSLPEGWVRHTNCEGQPFFYQEDKKILTEAWLYDSLFADLVKPVGDYLYSRAQGNLPKSFLDGSQLVISVRKYDYLVDGDDDGYRCGYYFAHHTKRHLAWLEKFPIDSYLIDVRGELSPEHIKLYIEHQYWRHFECFDDVQKPTEADCDELQGIITYIATDLLTSKTSTVNESKASIERMRQVLESRPTHSARSAHSQPAVAWLIGRLMSRLVKDRFQNFYGQYSARINSHQSVYGQTIKHSLAFEIVSPLLFFSAPDVHLKKLENMWADQVTRKYPWKKFVKKLTAEWEQHTFFGTILLTTNAAFLAIPSVDNDDHPDRLAKTLSFLSIMAGLGCIILGLSLDLQYKTRGRNIAKVAGFLLKQNRPMYGLESLAVMYSLPYALLMWGMVFFLCAFLKMCFTSQNRMTVALVSVAFVFIIALVLWCIIWKPEKWCWLVMRKSSKLRKALPTAESFSGFLGSTRALWSSKLQRLQGPQGERDPESGTIEAAET